MTVPPIPLTPAVTGDSEAGFVDRRDPAPVIRWTPPVWEVCLTLMMVALVAGFVAVSA